MSLIELATKYGLSLALKKKSKLPKNLTTTSGFAKPKIVMFEPKLTVKKSEY